MVELHSRHQVPAPTRSAPDGAHTFFRGIKASTLEREQPQRYAWFQKCTQEGAMRGKISCSAQKLSLLEPSMIESIVETSAYKIANHYLTENRVRIVEADEGQISSVIIGNSG